MARITKKDIYKAYGIEFDGDHILSPVGGWIAPLLVNGNTKLGLGVWTYSTLPGTGIYTIDIDGESIDVRGTCHCDCVGCYAKTGRYNCDNVVRSNAIKTLLAREHIEFMTMAIVAQIHADGIKLCRIHAAGDFDNAEYIKAWRQIAINCQGTTFWTYTKVKAAENAFNDIANVNVVKSVIEGVGYNFGHVDYIIDLYNRLTAAGAKVHVCRCGIDKNQHCNDCKGCVENDFVLFVEHSTGYNAKIDPRYNELVKLIDSQ